MVETYLDKEIREETERLKREEERRKASWWGGLPQKTKIIFIGLIIFILYWIWRGQGTNITETGKGLSTNTGIIILILVAVGIYFISKDAAPSYRSEKSHKDLMMLLSKQLEEMQRNPLTSGLAQLPEGIIRILPWTTRSSIEFQPFEKETSCVLTMINGRKLYFSAVQDVYTGNISDIIERKIPFTGQDSKKLRWLIPTRVGMQKKYEDLFKGFER